MLIRRLIFRLNTIKHGFLQTNFQAQRLSHVTGFRQSTTLYMKLDWFKSSQGLSDKWIFPTNILPGHYVIHQIHEKNVKLLALIKQ